MPTTVRDLKRLIANIPDNTPVGVSGHFGCMEPVDIEDFCLRGPDDGRMMCRSDEVWFQLAHPYIGEDPE